MPTQPAHYPVSVVAKQLGVVKQTIYNWLDAERLTAHTFVKGGTLYVVNDKQLAKMRQFAKTLKPKVNA